MENAARSATSHGGRPAPAGPAAEEEEEKKEVHLQPCGSAKDLKKGKGVVPHSPRILHFGGK